MPSVAGVASSPEAPPAASPSPRSLSLLWAGADSRVLSQALSGNRKPFFALCPCSYLHTHTIRPTHDTQQAHPPGCYWQAGSMKTHWEVTQFKRLCEASPDVLVHVCPCSSKTPEENPSLPEALSLHFSTSSLSNFS